MLLPPNKGMFDLGFYGYPNNFGVQSEYSHKLNKYLAIYGDVRAGLSSGKPDWQAFGGVKIEW